MNSLLHDAHYAARSLRRSPAFTLAAVATFALGIGATAAIFSVVNAALLEPPPYPRPDRILVLGYPDGGNQSGQVFHYVRDRAQSFEYLAAHSGSSGWNLVFGDYAEYATGVPVSEDFFEVLGAAPLLGRGFSRTEDQVNGPRAVALSEPLWRRVLGGRQDAIGEIVGLGGEPHLVVRVMPAAFRSMPAADLWTPLRLSATDNSWNYTVLGRLRDEVSSAEAAGELAS
jgi:putative ABC transport system permease protein